MIFINLLSWYLIIGLVGWLVFPLSFKMLSFLPDRGLALSRPLGLLLWGYLYWLLVSLHVLQNDAGGGLFGLLLVAGFSIFLLRKSGLHEITHWLKERSRLVFVTEGIFLFAFAAWVVIRAAMPDAAGTEKPMELAFINAIMRSPTFPPSDPWLSGYAISYYYFGYVLVALLAKLTALPGAVAFNLGLATWFALTGLAAYGLLFNLLALRGKPAQKVSLFSGLLAPFFILVAGNLVGILEMLHARGIFWNRAENGEWQSGFWSWLNIQELINPPATPLTWTPNRPAGIWWWRASRVLQDFALDKSPREVIDEFPMFSYLLGDLHPHVLAMPFALLAVGLALNIFLQLRELSADRLILLRWMKKPDFWLTALALGSLAFLNIWDFPIYVALFSAAAVLNSFLRDNWRFEILWDFLTTAMALGLAGIAMYLPFYLTFASQANGILPSLVFFTRGIHLWVMFGILLLPVVTWMAWIWKRHGSYTALKRGGLLAISVIVGLWVASSLVGLLQLISDPSLSGIWGAVNAQELILASIKQRLGAPGAWLTLLLLVGLGWGIIQVIRLDKDSSRIAEHLKPSEGRLSGSADPFILLIFLVGAALVIFPEYFYLRDQFGYRMNTIFKFYFQGWILWGIAAGYASSVLLRELRGSWRGIFLGGWSLLVLISLPYPIYGILSRTNNFQPVEWSLDGAASIQRNTPEEMEAIRWLQEASYGVIVEAVGGSYSGYARISTQTGLPTVLGWPGHESQWRGGAEEMGSRETDIALLFRAREWRLAKTVLDQYKIRYVYIGSLERSDFRPSDVLFGQHMPVVFQNSVVTIYEYLPVNSQNE